MILAGITENALQGIKHHLAHTLDSFGVSRREQGTELKDIGHTGVVLRLSFRWKLAACRRCRHVLLLDGDYRRVVILRKLVDERLYHNCGSRRIKLAVVSSELGI